MTGVRLYYFKDDEVAEIQKALAQLSSSEPMPQDPLDEADQAYWATRWTLRKQIQDKIAKVQARKAKK